MWQKVLCERVGRFRVPVGFKAVMDAFDGAMNGLDDELPLMLVQASWHPPLGCWF